ncbi:hypothetical protein B0J12DRAFT_29315 [Macrophomina phaseolina]|uniref:Uncharacterized protein n=1 Tax=Macrophomina phaseolina TaxID=35725 RepID=A0ABQ8GVF7_9PEZI|nr:hypothetical protein B0J12DRAFT_29315 [Macrophomina phaseolina]
MSASETSMLHFALTREGRTWIPPSPSRSGPRPQPAQAIGPGWPLKERSRACPHRCISFSFFFFLHGRRREGRWASGDSSIGIAPPRPCRTRHAGAYCGNRPHRRGRKSSAVHERRASQLGNVYHPPEMPGSGALLDALARASHLLSLFSCIRPSHNLYMRYLKAVLCAPQTPFCSTPPRKALWISQRKIKRRRDPSFLTPPSTSNKDPPLAFQETGRQAGRQQPAHPINHTKSLHAEPHLTCGDCAVSRPYCRACRISP